MPSPFSLDLFRNDQGSDFFFSFFFVQFPALVETCDRQISDFIASERARHETEFPNLGEFLILFTASTIPWERGAGPFVEEILQRSWRWIIKADPELGRIRFNKKDPMLPVEIEGVTDDELVTKVFQSSLNAIRITLLHVYFLNCIAHDGNMRHVFWSFLSFSPAAF